MIELLDAVTSWQPLVLVLLLFGFAPGVCLRLIVLTYPHNDPRRAELIAELRAVPRIERPLWVAEQLEVGLFEGLRHRVSEVNRRRRARAESAKPTVRRRRTRRFEVEFEVDSETRVEADSQSRPFVKLVGPGDVRRMEGRVEDRRAFMEERFRNSHRDDRRTS